MKHSRKFTGDTRISGKEKDKRNKQMDKLLEELKEDWRDKNDRTGYPKPNKA